MCLVSHYVAVKPVRKEEWLGERERESVCVCVCVCVCTCVYIMKLKFTVITAKQESDVESHLETLHQYLYFVRQPEFSVCYRKFGVASCQSFRPSVSQHGNNSALTGRIVMKVVI
jgi:hypothetical protein